MWTTRRGVDNSDEGCGHDSEEGCGRLGRGVWTTRRRGVADSDEGCGRLGTGLVAQLAERTAWYPKVLGSIPTFSTKHVTCLSPAVGGLK